MNIKFNCPSCSQTLEVSSEGVGQAIECPGCQQTIEIPATRWQEPPPAAPPSVTMKSKTFSGHQIEKRVADLTPKQLQKVIFRGVFSGLFWWFLLMMLLAGLFWFVYAVGAI
jgi:hypothetical protein